MSHIEGRWALSTAVLKPAETPVNAAVLTEVLGMVKSKSFRRWNPEQTRFSLRHHLVGWPLENHLVFFLLDLAPQAGS